MSLTIEKPLPSAEEIAERYPILPEHAIEQRRDAVRDILSGTDKRLMLIIGPCSAWPSEAVYEYADRLSRLQEEVSDRLLLVMRTYLQKPRTTIGWPGPLNQPHPKEPVDIVRGIEECSKMMDRVGRQLPLADEMLFTHNAPYFEDRLSYIAIGARSTEDMEHRYIASGLGMPVGMKNGTGGSIEIGVNGVLSAQAPHRFAHHQHQVLSSGNPHAHLILRGGGGRSNYDPESIAEAAKHLTAKKVKNPAIIVDASHDNSQNGSGKDAELQEIVLETVLSGIRRQRKEYNFVKGFMIESFLKDGKQSETSDTYDMGGLSITDPCLGWEKTERLIRSTAEKHLL